MYLGFPPETGFAITRLAEALGTAASMAVGSERAVITAWGKPGAALQEIGARRFLVDSRLDRAGSRRELEKFVRRERVWGMVGLDLPLRSSHVDVARQCGVASVVSYWGAPMCSEQPRFMRMLKRAQTSLARGRPDHFIFESEAMRRTGVVSLGIPASETSVVPIGIDIRKFTRTNAVGHCAAAFRFPPERRVIVYSGHFESRKGVAVLVDAAIELVDERGRTDVQFVLAGNRTADEAAPYAAKLLGRKAREHVTFAGYRDDLPRIFSDAYLGCIASTGWDSLTVSAIEMQAAGLPVLVSALQGLPEAILPGTTGETFPPGDARALADRIVLMLDSPERRDAMGEAAARYASRHLTREHYEARLAEVIRQQFLRSRGRWRQVNATGAVV